MAFPTTNMGLTAWDLEDDDFERAKLANNFIAIDNHDHSAGKGKRLGRNSLEEHIIDNSLLAKEAVHPENILKHSIGPEQIEEGFLPLGTVSAWYRKEGDTRLPTGGWEICDGRSWSTIPNLLGYSEGQIPDLRNRMILGADLTGKNGPTVNATGGSATVNIRHSHAVESHAHGVGPHAHSLPGHTHGIAADGSHAHGFGFTPFFNLFQHEVAAHVSGPGAQALWMTEFTTHSELEVKMGPSGVHAHGGATGIGGEGATGASAGFSTSGTAPNTDAQLNNISTLPPYIGLLYIMKVR